MRVGAPPERLPVGPYQVAQTLVISQEQVLPADPVLLLGIPDGQVEIRADRPGTAQAINEGMGA